MAVLIDATLVRAVLAARVDEAARRLELVPAELARVDAARRAGRCPGGSASAAPKTAAPAPAP